MVMLRTIFIAFVSYFVITSAFAIRVTSSIWTQLEFATDLPGQYEEVTVIAQLDDKREYLQLLEINTPISDPIVVDSEVLTGIKAPQLHTFNLFRIMSNNPTSISIRFKYGDPVFGSQCAEDDEYPVWPEGNIYISLATGKVSYSLDDVCGNELFSSE
jgi:hypothetical protein